MLSHNNKKFEILVKHNERIARLKKTPHTNILRVPRLSLFVTWIEVSLKDHKQQVNLHKIESNLYSNYKTKHYYILYVYLFFAIVNCTPH